MNTFSTHPLPIEAITLPRDPAIAVRLGTMSRLPAGTSAWIGTKWVKNEGSPALVEPVPET